MSAYRVRPATRGDCPAILAIYNEAVLTTTATYDVAPQSLAERQAWFEAHESSGHAVFVAETAAGEVAGWSSLNPHHHCRGYRFTAENSVYVAAAHRGRGVGALLLAPLIEAARARGLHVILAVVDAANAASLRLHEKFGFERAGCFREAGRKFGRWLDVLYLQRTLPLERPPED